LAFFNKLGIQEEFCFQFQFAFTIIIHIHTTSKGWSCKCNYASDDDTFYYCFQFISPLFKRLLKLRNI